MAQAAPATPASPAPVPVSVPTSQAAAPPPQAPAQGAPSAPKSPVPAQPDAQKQRLDSLARLEADKLRLDRELKSAQEKLKALEPEAGKYKALLERAKTDPLAVMRETGVSYAEITDHILKSEKDPPDPVKAAVEPLRGQVEDLKKQLEERETREAQGRLNAQVAAFKGEISKVLDNPDNFPALSLVPDRTEIVWQVINQQYAATGRALSAQEAGALAESYYVDLYGSMSKSEKLQAKLAALQAAASEQEPEEEAPPARSAAPKPPAKAPPAKRAPTPALTNRVTAAPAVKPDPKKETKEEKIKRIAAEMAARA